eukprot:6193869-Pleurochrysis_carterae.AAC.3
MEPKVCRRAMRRGEAELPVVNWSTVTGATALGVLCATPLAEDDGKIRIGSDGSSKWLFKPSTAATRRKPLMSSNWLLEMRYLFMTYRQLLEGQDALTPVIVRVNLGLRESPVVEHQRARAMRPALAVFADRLAVRLRLAAQREPV